VTAPVSHFTFTPSLILNAADVSDHSPSTSKPALNHVEQVHTNELVPGHNYYEKNGLRTEGDGENHEDVPMNFKRIMALIAMAFRKFLPLLL